MSHRRQVAGARARALFPALAYSPEDRTFLLEDASLGFGFLCRPLAGADTAEAERLAVLLNHDWPTDTLLQVLLWASPDLVAALARLRGLRRDTESALLRESAAARVAFLRAGTRRPLDPGSDLRVRDLVLVVTV